MIHDFKKKNADSTRSSWGVPRFAPSFRLYISLSSPFAAARIVDDCLAHTKMAVKPAVSCLVSDLGGKDCLIDLHICFSDKWWLPHLRQHPHFLRDSMSSLGFHKDLKISDILQISVELTPPQKQMDVYPQGFVWCCSSLPFLEWLKQTSPYKKWA